MNKPHSWNSGKYAAIVIDGNTDTVLFARNADKLRYPASLTKMMTLYILFDELSSGRLRKNTLMSVSRHASNQPPSCLGLRPGATISVNDSIRALVTKSANDVAVVIAEHISGSEISFTNRMTAVARQLGMKSTRFINASGLHDTKQYSTARDLSILSRALYHRHPRYYSYFSTKLFAYKARRYGNHNRLLKNINGIDGIKTGYTFASGYNLASSIRRGNRHLIAVVMGGPSGKARDTHVKNLLMGHLGYASTNRTSRRWRRVDTLALANIPLPNLRPHINATIIPFIYPSYVPTPIVLLRPPSVPIHYQDPIHSTQFSLVAAQSDATSNIEADDLVGQQLISAKNNKSFVDELSHRTKKRRWLIQIGAYDQQKIARAQLNEALLKESGLLKNRLGYTESVRKNNITLYRARFDGFNLEGAKRTCDKLKKAKFRCLPMIKG